MDTDSELHPAVNARVSTTRVESDRPPKTANKNNSGQIGLELAMPWAIRYNTNKQTVFNKCVPFFSYHLTT